MFLLNVFVGPFAVNLDVNSVKVFLLLNCVNVNPIGWILHLR